MDTNTVVKENKSVLPSALCVIVNVAVTYAVMLVCLFVFALVVTYTDFPEEFVSAAVLVMTVISVMLSGILTARKSGRKGWLCGAVSGVVYMLTLFGLSALAFRNAGVGINLVTMLALGLFAGTFGGILGINMKGARKNEKR